VTKPDRAYMQRTIDLGARAIAEDGRRPRPKVGAMLVDADRTVEAFRGQLGEGEHAEYTLLKRVLEGRASDAILYTTLEPCVTRGHPKRPCADHIILEGGIKHVVIGMLDPNPTISGKGVLRLREADIAVSLFDPDLMLQVETQNKSFVDGYRPLTARIATGILPLDWRLRSLDEWYRLVNTVYFTRNFHRGPDAIFMHLVEVVGGLGAVANGKITEPNPSELVVKAIAWWMALCGKIGVKSVEDLLWSKFPFCCPYCRTEDGKHLDPDCRAAKAASAKPEWAALMERGALSADRRPHTLREWQRMFRYIYPTAEPRAAMAKLTEELGELAEAVRVRHVTPGYFLNEAADVFAWLMQLQNYFDNRSDLVTSEAQAGEPLSEAFADAYPDRCARCHNQLCSCPAVDLDTVGRIAHDRPMNTNELLSIHDVMAGFGGWQG
jgi:pyrimidine deaminase RibD-like protein/NTP pyrophosphatase (non-canonical NTP hydrolase)